MFKRSRRKIIISIMTSLTVLFAITLSVILIASYREIRIKNAEMLERYIQSNLLTQQPVGQDKNKMGPMAEKHPGKDSRDYALSTFYRVEMGEDGTVLAVDNGNGSVYSKEELISLVQEILAGGKASGKIGSLFYQVCIQTGNTLVAFMDNTVADGSMTTLLRNYLIVGCSALVILFFFSLFLSKKIMIPLEENDKRQRQFISDASHELKTPVSVISANAELLGRELGANEWLSNIQYENERMGDLVKQLLDLSRAENTVTAMEPTDLSRIVAGEVLAFDSLAFEKGKLFSNDIEKNITIKGNPSQLTQLVSILLDNSIRHSTGNDISVSLRSQNHSAVLCVSNEGAEIQPEKMAHLFDRFYRVDDVRSSEDKHYGLGLSIAKAIAEKHGGKIEAACANRMIIFTVTLPQKNK